MGENHNEALVDTIKALAHDRHFFTADVRLEEYGQLLLIGDRSAVQRFLEVFKEHGVHDLVVQVDDPDDPPSNGR